jgi:hypothetical protein
MERLKKRLEQLEARESPTPKATWPRPGSVTGAEIRRLEAEIGRLERGEVGAAPSPEVDVAASVAPDDELAAVARKLEWLERLDHAPQGGERWT